jgi:cysteine desulfurase
MRKSLEIWDSHRQARQRHLAQLRDRFERRLEAEWPHLVIHGRHAARLPHTSNIAFPGFDRQALVVALDLAGVACSTGSACASGSSEPSPTLTAMRLPRELVDSSLRFSLGAFTTVEMIDDAVDRILMVLRQCHRDSAAPPSVARKQPASLL